MAGALYANNISTTLSGGVGPSDGTITVVSSAGMPSPTAGDWFWITIQSVDGLTIEILKCTSRAGAVLTVTRAQDGTTASAFTAGAFVEMRAVAQLLRDLLSVSVASGMFLTPAAAAATYETIAHAAATFETQAHAAATYTTPSAVAAVYETQAHAAATYMTPAQAAATYITPAAVAATYETIAHAAATFATPGWVDGNYLPRTGGAVGPLTINGGKILSKITVSSGAPDGLIDGELFLRY